jgi:hypothetical protein
LSRLTANQGATIGGAPSGKAPNDVREDMRLKLARAKVIEKKERLRSQHGDVIDTMIDQVLANGVVTIHREGDLEFGAHAIDAGYQYRLPELPRVQGKEPAESTHSPEHFPSMRGGTQVRQGGLDPVTKVDIYARAGVRFPFH